ncbi:unnamed protein product, partial [marine sediment metagenome]
MNNSQSKTVIVLGMHRSGTSMVAGILNKLDINMGKKMIGKSASNPLGHFEDKDFFDLNNRILETSGGSWDFPPEEEDIIAQKDKFKKEIRDLVTVKSEGRSKYWGWKDPRTSLTIKLYLPYLSNPYFIVCHRETMDVAESLQRRNDMEIQKGIKLREIYKERICKFFTEFPKLRKIDLYYKDVMQDPKECVRKIVNFLNIQVNKEEHQKAINFILPKGKIHKLEKKVRILNWLYLIIAGFKKPW